jgi:hypothetical protein
VPNLVHLDRKIQRGRGKAAWKAGGQQYDVYRLNGRTNVAVTSTEPIRRSHRARIERTTSKKLIENTTFELLVFEATTDNRQLELMDVLVERGFNAMPQGSYIVAQKRPSRPTLLVRVEANVTISAMDTTAGAASQQPASGNRFISGMVGWSADWKENEQLLTLINGEYAFKGVDDPYWQQPGAAPAQIQVGLQPNARVRDGNALEVPTEQPRAPFCVYIPITPGVFLEETKSVINFGNAASDRYRLTKYFTSDLTGLAGQIALCEKLPF